MQHVPRYARLMQKLDCQKCRHRRLLGRLGNHAIAGCQSGGNLSREDGNREIPWTDAREYTAAAQLDAVALAGRARKLGWSGKQAARFASVVAQEVHRFAQIALCVLKCLAG